MARDDPSEVRPLTAAFDAYYFAHCCGRPYARNQEWLEFFGRIADRIVSDLAPRRVLDAGCAWGLLVEALRARGVDAWGIDISGYAIAQVAPEMRPYCRVGSVAGPLGERFDLIVCQEVLEHLPPAEGDRTIDTLCAYTDTVLFSSSPFDLREPTHVGVRGPGVWAERFARHQFFRDVEFDVDFMTPWAVLFRKESPTTPALVRRYERWAFEADHACREARAQALETQGALADAERRLERLVWLETKATELVAEVQTRTLERDDAEFEHARIADQLGAALGAIRAMERSLFWRLRAPWAALSRWLGRS